MIKVESSVAMLVIHVFIALDGDGTIRVVTRGRLLKAAGFVVDTLRPRVGVRR